MKRGLIICTGLLAVAALAVGSLLSIRDTDAQSSAPPRVFQTEVQRWAAEGTDTSTWQFTYLADGSLHVVSVAEDGTCAQIAVPGGVFVSFIDPDGVTASQPGNDQTLTICEAFFTRANG